MHASQIAFHRLRSEWITPHARWFPKIATGWTGWTGWTDRGMCSVLPMLQPGSLDEVASQLLSFCTCCTFCTGVFLSFPRFRVTSGGRFTKVTIATTTYLSGTRMHCPNHIHLHMHEPDLSPHDIRSSWPASRNILDGEPSRYLPHLRISTAWAASSRSSRRTSRSQAEPAAQPAAQPSEALLPRLLHA